jgi:type IV pilus assembly protein PilZ
MSRNEKKRQADGEFEERRSHERFETSYAVDYTSGDTFLFAYLQNISEMGIFIRTDTPMEVGTELKLRFQVADQEPLLVEGEVIWVNPYRESGDNLNPGMGVRFKRLTSELREQVVDLVRTIAYLREEDENGDDN